MTDHTTEDSKTEEIVRRVEGLLLRDDETLARPASETRGWTERGSVEPLTVPPGYEVLGTIGAGGMGVVLKVRNVALSRVEAFKTIRAGEFAGPKPIARFRFEAEAAAGLDHSNIVTVYNVGDSRGGPYLTMRWIDGASLDARRPTTACEIANLLAKVARAVHFAHQRGILHRDLKPQNILVDATGEPFVADFGIARRLDADSTVTQDGTPIGTPAYMAPEQARGEAKLTVAADVYSLGVILYQLLTGTVPYTGSIADIFSKLKSDEAPLDPHRVNPSADPDLSAVCMKCLEKEPTQRYGTADDLADDLDRFLRGEAVTARPPGFWDWVRRLAMTRPEPHPHYSWEVTTWFGALILAASVASHLIVKSAAPAIWVWVSNGVCAVSMIVVLWWYMIRHFTQLPPTERHSLIIAAGSIGVYVTLTATHVPLSLSATASPALGMYPAMMACCGLGLFTLGSTNWSRFFPLGAITIGIYPVLVWWPEYATLVFGGTIAVVMWYWSYAKKVTFSCLAPRPPKK